MVVGDQKDSVEIFALNTKHMFEMQGVVAIAAFRGQQVFAGKFLGFFQLRQPVVALAV